MLNEALPLDRVTLPRSAAVLVSKKSTLPVGVPEPGALAVIVAVRVRVCPVSAVVLSAVNVTVGIRSTIVAVRVVLAGFPPSSVAVTFTVNVPIAE